MAASTDGLGKTGRMLAIDDATETVVNALFYELENTRSYFSLLCGLIRRCGMPPALYADRHAVFKHTASPETAAGPTRFSRAMDELGIQLIYAQSPQAKGRVERAAGTFQDRLVAELHLAGARHQPHRSLILWQTTPMDGITAQRQSQNSQVGSLSKDRCCVVSEALDAVSKAVLAMLNTTSECAIFRRIFLNAASLHSTLQYQLLTEWPV